MNSQLDRAPCVMAHEQMERATFARRATGQARSPAFNPEQRRHPEVSTARLVELESPRTWRAFLVAKNKLTGREKSLQEHERANSMETGPRELPKKAGSPPAKSPTGGCPLSRSSPKSATQSDSLRSFFRARFRAKACFTRRFAPGFR